jgi:hypothetical protein
MTLRLKYSPSKMKQAIASVKSGALSRRKAAELFGVPKTTLLDKLSGRGLEESSTRPSYGSYSGKRKCPL